MVALGALAAAAITLVLCPLLIRELRRRLVIDSPVERSSHSVPTPRGGGLAPAIGSCAGLLIAVGTSEPTLLAVAGIAVAYGALGLVDDVSTISVRHRLIAQSLIGAVGIVALASGMTGGAARVGLLAVGLLWLAGYVNAFNFMDGINGISAVQVAVAGGAWLLVGAWLDDTVLVAGASVAVAAVMAFAPFNVPHAQVFLGDVGSYYFGGWLAAMAVVGLDHGLTLEMTVAPLALYGCDTGVTLLRRVVRGEPWSVAHKEHTYQRLVVGGWSHARTSAFVGLNIALSAALGALTLNGSIGLRVAVDLGIVVLVLVYLASPALQAVQHNVATPDVVANSRQ